MSTYLRIHTGAEGEYREKGSKFIGCSFPVFSEDEVRAHLDELRKQHHQARHVAYAYRLNPVSGIERANDDGEPSHTAGTPILHAIQSAELFETAVFVVRYYGGTKLGKPGLIKAYRTAAEESLAQSSKETFEEIVQIELHFSYEQMSMVQAWLNRQQLKPLKAIMDQKVRMLIELPIAHKEMLLAPLMADGRITFVEHS